GKTPVETRKARVGSKNRRPGYFEPTKAVSGDKMDLSLFFCEEPVDGQSKDRWNPVERPLLYLNFRSELSAFDKFFYFGAARPTPQPWRLPGGIARGATPSSRAIAGATDGLGLHGRRMMKGKEDVSSQELSVICELLGKAYPSATLIRHSYYGYAPG